MDAYDNDDFENYDDDFDVGDSPKSEAKPSRPDSNAKASQQQEKPSNSMLDILTSMQKENMAIKKSKDVTESKDVDFKSVPRIGENIATNSNVIDDDFVPSSSVNKPTTASRRSKKYGGPMELTVEGTLALDSRYRRLTKLMESGVLDLQEEKFLNVNILPSTSYDLYTRQLRNQPPVIKQIGAPNDLETREMEVNTDEITMVDKELQYCYGDDTAFLNIIRAVQESTRLGKSRVREAILQNKSQLLTSSNNKSNEPTDELGQGSKLVDFLQKSSSVMESLLDESSEYYSNLLNDRSKLQAATYRSNILSKEGLFNEENKWKYLGDQVGNGGNELIRTRSTVVVKHSELQPYLLATAHPAPLQGIENDLRPFKALYAIWEINNSSGPAFILESHGSPTCLTFSKSQSFLLLAGTNEGCLYMWNLRESSSYHKDRDANDLKIEHGIRKPCYSTSFMLGADSMNNYTKSKKASSNSNQTETIMSHYLPIVQVESIGEIPTPNVATSTVSQFVSMDLSGLTIFWVTNNEDSMSSDPGMSPWSEIKLVPTRSLQTLVANPNMSLSTVSDSSATKKDSKFRKSAIESDAQNEFTILGPRQESKQYATAIASLSSDLSSIVVANFDHIRRVSRYGAYPNPNIFDRFIDSSSLEIKSSSPRSNLNANTSESNTKVIDEEIVYKGFVTSISTSVLQGSCDVVRGGKNEDYEIIELMLVGRSDGSIDLFRLNHGYPILSWNITDYEKPSSKSNKGSSVLPRNASVVIVKWCPSRKAAFFVIDNHGTIYYFDLLESFDGPISIDTLGVNISSQSLAVESYLSSSSPLNSASPKGPAYPTLVDISLCRSGTNIASIAVVDSISLAKSKGPGGDGIACKVRTRRIREEALKGADDEESKLMKLLNERVGYLDGNIKGRVIRFDSNSRK